MTFSNDFKAFAIGGGANVETPSAWAADTSLALGFQSGQASSTKFNTALRQSTSIMAMIAQFTADYGPGNVQDNGVIATLETQFSAALISYLSTRLPTYYVPIIPQTIFYVATTGNDSNPGTLALPFATLAGAKTYISQFSAPSGVTINVAAGTYTSASNTLAFSAGKTLVAGWTIVGAGVGSTIIDASATGCWGFTTNGDTVTVSGLMVKHYNGAFSAQSGGIMYVGAIAAQGVGSTSSTYGAGNSGTISINGPQTLTGTVGSIFSGTSGGDMTCGYTGGAAAAFNVSGLTITISTAVMGLAAALVLYPANTTWTGTPGGTGQRFSVGTAGGVNSFGSGYQYFPCGGYASNSGTATYTLTSPGYYV